MCHVFKGVRSDRPETEFTEMWHSEKKHPKTCSDRQIIALLINRGRFSYFHLK